MDGCWIIKCGLSVSIYAGNWCPNAHRAPEVISYIHGHHVLDTQAEVCRAFDLRRAEEWSGTVNAWNIILVPRLRTLIIIIMYNVCMIIIVFWRDGKIQPQLTVQTNTINNFISIPASNSYKIHNKVINRSIKMQNHGKNKLTSMVLITGWPISWR